MANKPKIQYVGQFYVYGSEAQVLAQKEKKKSKAKPLLARQLEKIPKIYIDPVALGGILVAVLMVAAMAVGLQRLQTDWAELNEASAYLSCLKAENAGLNQTYRETYDLEDVARKASSLGMVPREEAETMDIYVRVPEKEPEETFLDYITWFFKGLFA